MSVSNRPPAGPSLVKACKVRMPIRLSPAWAAAPASASCASLVSLRTPRPEITSGRTISGMATSTISDSLALVRNIITKAAISISRFRKVCENALPTALRIWPVSAVSRETSSPVCAVS